MADPPPLRVSLAVKYPYFTSRLTRKLKWRMLHKDGSISKCSLGKKFSIRNASFRLEIRSNGQKYVFYLYKNKLFNQFHAIKTISSCCEKYKLKHEAELFSKSRNYSGCFQPLGQMSYYLGSCIPNLFLSPTGMHALGLLKCIRNIPNRPFFSNDFTFWLITHSHFSNKIPFYKQRHDEQSVKIC